MEKIRIELTEKEKDSLIDCVVMYSKMLVEALKNSDTDSKKEIVETSKNILNIQYKLQAFQTEEQLTIKEFYSLF